MSNLIKRVREDGNYYIHTYNIESGSLSEAVFNCIKMYDEPLLIPIKYVTGMGGMLKLLNEGILEDNIIHMPDFDNVLLSTSIPNYNLPASSYEVDVYYGSTMFIKLIPNI